MICNNPNHDLNCKYHNNTSKQYNALKGASAVVNNNQQSSLVFNQSEVNLISKTIELIKYYITQNQQMFQQPQDIIEELNTAINILSVRRQDNNNNNESNLKGASDNNNPFKSLDNIRKMFGLTTNNESILKGASDSTQNNNNICSKKEHLKDLLKLFNLNNLT